MKPFASLQSRIFWTSALLAVLSIGAAVYLISVRAAAEAEKALDREIEATRAMVNDLRARRTETFTLMARLIADAPTLKAAVDTSDPPTVQRTIQDIAKTYHEQLESNLLLVTGPAGNVLGSVGTSPRAALVVASQPAVRSAAGGRTNVSLIPQHDGILQLVTVPIAVGLTYPDVLGTLSVGFLLDDRLADQLNDTTGSQIAFGMDGQILAATLPPDDRPALAHLLRAEGRQTVLLSSGEYVALSLPLGNTDNAPGSGPIALLLRSRTEHLRFLSAIHTELGVTAVVAVLLATLLSFGVARTITRPLGAITRVMREVASTGDLTRKIMLRSRGRWEDEDARLLADTFNTLTDSVARFQREMSQRERLSSLGRLSTVIAHEIRNPLMIIKAALHTLNRDDADAAARREAATDIDGEVVRLNRIVNEVLDFARPIHFELATADLNAVCRESAAAAQVVPGPRVALDLDPQVPPVRIDAERLRSALVNLIVNARNAVEARPAAAIAGSTSAHGHNEHEVSVTTRHMGDRVALTIADAGVGIESGDLARIFDPYFTTQRGGTGLGLPIAKNIIDGMGGVIAVASMPGRGTEFRIDLPIEQPAGDVAAFS
jgi:signal transduction histidine kinase